MIYLFKIIPTSLSPKQNYHYKKKYHTTIKAVGGKFYIDNMNANIYPIKIS